MAKLGYGVI